MAFSALVLIKEAAAQSVRTEATELACTAEKDSVGTDRKHFVDRSRAAESL